MVDLNDTVHEKFVQEHFITILFKKLSLKFMNINGTLKNEPAGEVNLSSGIMFAELCINWQHEEMPNMKMNKTNIFGKHMLCILYLVAILCINVWINSTIICIL